MIIPVVTFLVLFTIVYGAYWLFVIRPEEQAAGVVKRRLKASRPKAAAVSAAILRQRQALSAVAPINALLERGQARTRGLQELIEQAGLQISVGTLLAGTAALAALVFWISNQATGLPLLALGAAVLAAFVPINVVKYKRTVRMRKFEEQFPEALDLLGRALRAGHAFPTGIEMVADEMPDPIGPEFRILFDQQNYGMPFPDALRAFAQRIPVLDARFFVTAVLIQRESGGNLSEVLDNLAAVMRERFRVKRQMRVLSAHGRITGWILAGLPPVLAIVMFAFNEEHRNLMLYHPLGQQMLMGAVVLQVIGALIMRKIINVEY
jgi:tight adherence protein B